MASYNFLQATSSTVWTINHNLNSNFLATDAMKQTISGVYQKVLPFKVTLPNANVMVLEFEVAIAGRARVVAGTLT
jgi:hypothetical protein